MEDKTESPASETEAPVAPTNPSPMPSGPVMDVVPPPTPQDAGEVAVATEPESDHSAAATEQPEAPALAPTKTDAKTQKPGPTQAKTHTAPVAAIVLAVFAFIVLAGLAYYAYSKG